MIGPFQVSHLVVLSNFANVSLGGHYTKKFAEKFAQKEEVKYNENKEKLIV